MAIVQTDVVIDPALTNLSIKYTNEEAAFVANEILPVLRVGKQTGKYYIYDKANLRIENTNRAAGSPSNEADYSLSLSGVFSCDDHALKGLVQDEVQDQAEAALNPLIDETETLTEKLMLDRELTAATMLTDTAQMTSNTTLSGTSQWSDYSNSDPISDVRTARISIHTNTFKKPNVMLMSKTVWDQLVEHPSVIERIKYSQLGVASLELVAKIFQVSKILVAEAGYNSAAEGITDSLGYVWGKHCILAYVTPAPKLKTVTLGFTFTYGDRQVKRWYDEDREGTYVRVGKDNYVQKLVVPACGYLIKNAVA